MKHEWGMPRKWNAHVKQNRKGKKPLGSLLQSLQIASNLL